MSTTEYRYENDFGSENIAANDWRELSSFRCHLMIVKDEDGGYSAIALNLPGAGSCGDTLEEAEANAKEAVAAVIGSYLSDGVTIPWCDTKDADIPNGACHKWVLVNA